MSDFNNVNLDLNQHTAMKPIFCLALTLAAVTIALAVGDKSDATGAAGARAAR
jgi:hypothetical protein